MSNPVSLSLELPTVSLDSFVRVQPESEALVSCNVTGAINFISVMWTGPDGRVLAETDRASSSDSVISMLRIANISYSEGGNYTCTASSIAGSISTTISVLIYPRLSPSVLTARQGENQTFTCERQTLGMFSVSFERIPEGSGMLLPSMDGSEVLSQEIGSGGSGLFMDGSELFPRETAFTFQPVSFGDEGMYQCVVSDSQFGQMLSDEALLIGILHAYT